MLGTQGNGCPKSAGEQGFAISRGVERLQETSKYEMGFL